MPRYEYWDISDPALTSLQGDLWQGQTFTPVVAHTIESVLLTMYRVGNPGTITVSIKATDVDGHPDGADLAVDTTDGDTLPTLYAGEEREIAFGVGAALTDGTKYAIVVAALTGDQSNYVRWRSSKAAPYPRGNHEFSSDGGVTWETDATRDMMFEEWGTP